MGLCCTTLCSPGSSSPSYKFSVERETYGKTLAVKLCRLRIWYLGRSISAAILHRASTTGEFCRKPFSRILTLFAQEENTTNIAVNGTENVRSSMHNNVTVNGFPRILLVTRNRYPAQGYF